MTTPGKPQPASAPPQFFVDNKKSEVNELRTLLKGIMNERNVNKRREVIKKVIAYMTLGIDVSKLFTDMVLISSTNDIVQKKMIYLYLVSYVEANQDQALMAINTFSKDCRRTNPDAKIRGLALRTLCSLRFPGAVEYIQGAITEGLGDPDPYVRRTAIIGLIKLHRHSKDQGTENSFINTLYELIRDPDPTVSSNAIIALNEILENEGGIAINRKMCIYLLNRIHQFNEFGQSTIFDIIARYVPQDDEEMLDILNILEDKLRHASSSVVLGCIKVFMNLTKDNPALLKQVFSRVQAPLITLFVGGEVAEAYELSYCVLAHINLIISRGAAEVFENDYKNFFCKYDEPTYIKFLKIDILKMIATENNLNDIVNELCAYVTDVNIEMSKQSIRGIATIAMRIQSSSTAVIRQLIGFLSCGIDYVITETLVSMKDLLRKYRNLSSEIINQLASSLEIVNNDEGKAAIIWMIGEFGNEIEDAPYILQGIVDNTNPSENLQITYALLTASVKLFLKRAPEMQNTLSTLFKLLFNDCDNPDIHDRAGFYYKLLQSDPDIADQIINCDKHPIQVFYEDDRTQLTETLCQEFNQLSVIYQKPSKAILKPAAQLVADEGEGHIINSSSNHMEPQATDLLSLDLLDQNLGDITSSSFSLEVNPSMESDEFQNLWATATDQQFINERLSRPAGLDEVENNFARLNILCMASGEDSGLLKLYFYAREASSGSPFLIELNVFNRTGEVQLTAKAQNGRWMQDFLGVVYQALMPIINRSQ
ncbi:unnamed protein product [Blepharisma stoltei]|uniref:Beta-adaptin appendage C-terminal subdomain domain-containing protein n=1 Tax=Blepharisma stoltei TaxID=1481888 RepID=A0AAU9IVR9_9CILI|nr:unnamed protein product [Blepharisma stoltei]